MHVPLHYSLLLAAFALLFIFRVCGQILVAIVDIDFLPPFEQMADFIKLKKNMTHMKRSRVTGIATTVTCSRVAVKGVNKLKILINQTKPNGISRILILWENNWRTSRWTRPSPR